MITESTIWLSWLVIFILSVTLIFVAWKYWQGKSALSAFSEAKREIEKLTAENKQFNDSFSNLKPAVEKLLKLRDGLLEVNKATDRIEKVRQLHQLMTETKTWPKGLGEEGGKRLLDNIFTNIERGELKQQKALRIVNGLETQIESFYEELKKNETLDNLREAELRSQLLTLTMVMMDNIQSVACLNYVPEAQGINVKLLNNEISLSEAQSLARIATQLDEETPKWAQNLYSALIGWGNESRPFLDKDHGPYILNGYKFLFN